MGKRYIDLSWPISNGMPVYPGDSSVNIIDTNIGKKERWYEQFILQMPLHAGTHIDGLAHVRKQRASGDNCSIQCIADVPLDRFVGNGCILDVRGMQVIGYSAAYEKMVREGDIVLLYTGFDKQYGTQEYYTNHPMVSKELAQFFVDKKVCCVGIDAPSVEQILGRQDLLHDLQNSQTIHQMLFDNNILILENVCNMQPLLELDAFELFCFPLKVMADSSPVRIVARY